MTVNRFTRQSTEEILKWQNNTEKRSILPSNKKIT